VNRPASSPERLSWIILIVALYLVVAVPLAWLSRYHINPDGVAYVEHARHWARGDLALAGASWWSPLLSWLLVPFIWVRVDPLVAVKALNIVFGLAFAAGVRAVVRELTGGHGARVAFVGGLLLALTMLPEPVTPDLLLTCLLTWYFARAMTLVRSDSVAAAAGVGLLGGVAYLAKAYALPFVLLHLPMTLAVKIWWKKRDVAPSVMQYVTALSVVALVTVPWVAAISRQDGRVTISGSGRYWSAWSFLPAPKPMQAYARLQLPREGRLATWESAVEARDPWSLWSAFDGPTELRYQALTIVENLRWLPRALNTADVWGLLPVSFVVSVILLLPLRETLKTGDGLLRAWACLSVVLFVSGYVTMLVLDRYLWPIRGLLLALAIAGPGVEWARALGDARVGVARTFARWHRTFVYVLLASIGLYVAGTYNEWRGLSAKRALGEGWKHAGEAFVPGCRFAATRYGPGLYVTYWSRGVFLGEVAERTPEAITRALAPFGNVTLIVAYDPNLAERLLSNPTFTRIDLGNAAVQAFGVAGGGCPTAHAAR
jgi:hypothetical protein